MAGVRFAAVTGEVATGTSAKTILQVVAASNQRVLVDEVAVSFKGMSATDAPILVEVLRQTTAGTMSSLTPRKLHDGDDESLQVTAQHSATSEPTAGDVLLAQLIHPQTGYTWQAPFGRQLHVKGGGRLGVRVTAGVSVNCVARVVAEE
jgi:hypothetical protein